MTDLIPIKPETYPDALTVVGQLRQVALLPDLTIEACAKWLDVSKVAASLARMAAKHNRDRDEARRCLIEQRVGDLMLRRRMGEMVEKLAGGERGLLTRVSKDLRLHDQEAARLRLLHHLDQEHWTKLLDGEMTLRQVYAQTVDEGQQAREQTQIDKLKARLAEKDDQLLALQEKFDQLLESNSDLVEENARLSAENNALVALRDGAEFKRIMELENDLKAMTYSRNEYMNESKEQGDQLRRYGRLNPRKQNGNQRRGL